MGVPSRGITNQAPNRNDNKTPKTKGPRAGPDSPRGFSTNKKRGRVLERAEALLGRVGTRLTVNRGQYA